MSDHQKLKETLSAFIDNEAGKVDQLELRRLVRSLDEHPDLLETYQRYMLVRNVLNSESPAMGMVSNVRAAIAKENMEEAPPTSVLSHANTNTGFNGFRVVSRLAIAASVAVIAVYLVQIQSPVVDLSQASQIVAAKPVQPVTTNALTQQSNRILNPRVMNVSAGDNPSFGQISEQKGSLPTGCTLNALREDNSEMVWQKELPAGYVLCKQNEQTKNCETVSSKIGCYLN